MGTYTKTFFQKVSKSTF